MVLVKMMMMIVSLVSDDSSRREWLCVDMCVCVCEKLVETNTLKPNMRKTSPISGHLRHMSGYFFGIFLFFLFQPSKTFAIFESKVFQ